MNGRNRLPSTGARDERRPDFSSSYCTIDNWYASLHESLIYFGPHAKRVHRLDPRRDRFGLSEVIRHYEPEHQPEFLALFETLSPQNPAFDFRSRLPLGQGQSAEVHWSGSLDIGLGRIHGIILITEPRTGL